VYRNGSELVIGGLDDPTKVMSSEYDVIFIDEATEITETDWESCMSRLRNNRIPYQQIIAAVNPGAPTHWLNQRANKGQMRRLVTRHEHNPAYFDQKSGVWTEQGQNYLRILDRLTGVRRMRLLDGIWAQAEGVIYDEFDATVHVLKEDLPWSSFRKFVGSIDWGFTHAGVIQVWGIDHDGRMILVHEVFMTERTIDWWLEQAKQLRQQYRVEVFVCDSARPDYIMQMKKSGVPAVEAYKAVDIGIQAVKQRLIAAGDGRPRLLLMHDALKERDEKLVEAKRPWATAQEFDSYVWKKTADGRAKEEPVKENDDGLDAMRYAVAYIDNLSVNKVNVTRLGGEKNG
jgi:phage terminase large subunit